MCRSGRARAPTAEAVRQPRVESHLMSRTRPLTFLPRVAMAIAPAVAALPCIALSSEALSGGPKPYTYVDEARRHWCGTIAYVEANGPGGVSFGWFIFDAEPRRLVHVPMADLLSGCASRR
jgi:hypothetical protein